MLDLTTALLALFPLVPCAPADPGDVVAFCDALPNSTGQTATLEFTGGTDAGNLDLSFLLSDVPPDNWGMLIFSYGPLAEYPFGQGVLCLNPYFPDGLYRASAPFLSGDVPSAIDAFLPADPQPGQWHYFQAFYRDFQAGGFNTSTAIAIEFEFPPG